MCLTFALLWLKLRLIKPWSNNLIYKWWSLLPQVQGFGCKREKKKKNQWTKCRFMGKRKIDYQGEVRGKWKSNGLEITTMFGVEVFPNSA